MLSVGPGEASIRLQSECAADLVAAWSPSNCRRSARRSIEYCRCSPRSGTALARTTSCCSAAEGVSRSAQSRQMALAPLQIAAAAACRARSDVVPGTYVCFFFEVSKSRGFQAESTVSFRALQGLEGLERVGAPPSRLFPLPGLPPRGLARAGAGAGGKPLLWSVCVHTTDCVCAHTPPMESPMAVPSVVDGGYGPARAMRVH
eukprot:SAG31_NODE_7645_length_1632_cov_1.858355_2_plen_203_part_00